MPSYRVTIDTSRLVDTHEPGNAWQRYCEDGRGSARDRARVANLGNRDGDADVWTVRGSDEDSVRRCVERLTKGHDVTIESIERT